MTDIVLDSEVNSGFFYKSADEREKLVKAERHFIEARVQKIIDLKKKVCDGTDKTFVVLNQKVLFIFTQVSFQCYGFLITR